uniref:Uncharacterized protein n=1 Tax=Anguilla anguilla TaxID=7936 RepID=A0A0E9WSK8_ANGAN
MRGVTCQNITHLNPLVTWHSDTSLLSTSLLPASSFQSVPPQAHLVCFSQKTDVH